MKLTPKQRAIIDGLAARSDSFVSRRWVGYQVARCCIPDPKSFRGVTAAEMDVLADWDVSSAAVDSLCEKGLIEITSEWHDGRIGTLTNFYEQFRGAGRALAAPAGAAERGAGE